MKIIDNFFPLKVKQQQQQEVTGPLPILFTQNKIDHLRITQA